MYSMDDLLLLVKSDEADALRLRVGRPPVVVLEGKHLLIERPAIPHEDAEQLLRGLASTRQRRELRERGFVQFVYRFRGATDFVVRAWIEDAQVGIDIH
jgi:Tfp pilus assembly ATPase PilU